MSYAGAEPIIDLILTQLKTYLPAELALRAAGPPVLPMPAPVTTEFTYGERQLHTTYPAIEVFDVTTPVDIDSNDTLITRGNIGIAIFVRAAKEEDLCRLIERYGWAVIQVLLNRRAAQAFGNVGIDFNNQTLDWSPTRVIGRAVLERDVMFALRASKGESRT